MLRNRKSADRSITGMSLRRSGPATEDDKYAAGEEGDVELRGEKTLHLTEGDPGEFPLNGGNACSRDWEDTAPK